MSTIKKKSCWRRCCPNGCCGFCKAPVQVQAQVDTLVHVSADVEKTKVRYGYIKFYPGVRTADNGYTCPMLSVHLYKHSQFQVDGTQNNRIVTIDGKNRGRVHQGERGLMQIEKASAEEEVLMIPLEDVTRITYKAEFTKGIDAVIKSHVEPTYDLTDNGCDRCCGALRDCCCPCCRESIQIAPEWQKTVITAADPNRKIKHLEENIPLPKENKHCCTKCCDSLRCWCCRKKKLVKLTKKTQIVQEQEAQRVITMTIEYSMYSHPDSASNARLLSNEHQAVYYKERFQPDTQLQFYLDNSADFDNKSFEEKRQQAEVLSRTVMQLKALRNHYPSEEELERILDQTHRRIFGLVFEEPVLELSSNATIAENVTGTQMQHLPSSIQVLAMEED